MNVKEFPEVQQVKDILASGPITSAQLAHKLYPRPCSRDFYRAERILEKMLEQKMISCEGNRYALKGVFVRVKLQTLKVGATFSTTANGVCEVIGAVKDGIAVQARETGKEFTMSPNVLVTPA